MDNDYWQQKWQARDIGFNQSQPNKLLQGYFSLLQCEPGCRVFVPLCGQSIDMLWLAGQGYQVIGVEVSPIACHAFFAENNIPVSITETNGFTLYISEKITIFCGDFFMLDQALLGKIDAVYDRAALIALPENQRKRYAKHLMALLTPATTMFLITTAYNQNDMNGPPFSVDETEVIEHYGARFDVHQVYNKAFKAPDHLREKGLVKAREQAYVLTINS